MTSELIIGLAIPFLGTILGSSMVFFMRNKMIPSLEKILMGFASGVMIAASIWSLIIPATEMTAQAGKAEWVPTVVGVLLGMGFFLLLDGLIPHTHIKSNTKEGIKCNLGHQSRLMLAVTLHNIPEGMAVGVIFAGWMSGDNNITLQAAMVLAIGLAIQNFPEGAIISMPLRAASLEHYNALKAAQATTSETARKNDVICKFKAFWFGTLSGAVEPVAAILAILLTSLIEGILPYALSFAAGCMIYVVIEELIPESQAGKHSNFSTIGFAFGFVLMFFLDTTLI
ncbi:MAG: ZIP family metal transporter [Bacteroidales bacterium]